MSDIFLPGMKPIVKKVHAEKGRKMSYSEMSTFKDCVRKHFYRYHLRLESKRYDQRRHLTIGSITHDTIEAVYRRKIDIKTITKEQVWEIAEDFALKQRKKYDKVSHTAFFYEDMFVLDAHVAKWCAWMFFYCLQVEGGKHDFGRIIAPEVKFEIDIGGYHFIGIIDQLYDVPGGVHAVGRRKKDRIEVPPGLYVGEVKTRGFSFSSRLETVVGKDLQTKIYMAALIKRGRFPQGVIYTTLKKPKAEVWMPDVRDAKEQKTEIDEFYDTNKDKMFKRQVVPVKIDLANLEEEIAGDIENLETFYKDPFMNITFAERYFRGGFPCAWCEYAMICHDNKPLGDDFTYKKRRRV